MEDMKRVSIKRPSDRIISRMRNGHQVRMMKGEGLDIMMKPSKIIKMAKKFMTGKGVQMSLDSDELSANKGIEGSGIFGKKFDKALSKTPGLKKAAYAVGSAAKPLVKQGIKAAEAMAITYGVPPSIAKKIGDTADQYIEDPSSLQGKKGLRELKKRGISLGQEVADMGTSQMGMDKIDVADIVKTATAKRVPGAPKTDFREAAINMAGQSLADKLRARFSEAPVAGQGLYAGRGLGMGARIASMSRRSMSAPERSVMGRGALIGGEISPALRSQPYASNYQFGVTLGPFLRR
jgi:hypothetical protein